MSDRQSRKDFTPPVVSMDRQVRTNKIEYDQATVEIEKLF